MSTTNPDEVRAGHASRRLSPSRWLPCFYSCSSRCLLSLLARYLLLYGDAVAHLGNRAPHPRLAQSRLSQLGGVWLPLPHLLMLPFVQKMEWWQNGLAGAWPSLLCYVAGVAGFYRLARRMLVPRWAIVATAFYALNPNLLYLCDHRHDRAALSRAA